jgi:hypothetical protein
MKKIKLLLLIAAASMLGCADNSFDEYPLADNFPFQLVLDSEQGADLADAEDFDIEFKLADYLPGNKVPNTSVALNYAIVDLEGDMIGNVGIDKIKYEVEIDECIYERELDFESAADGLSGTINIVPDLDLGSIPESFEIILTLPAKENTEGAFKVVFSGLHSLENIELGFPNVFEYEVLDNDVAGEWETEITSVDDFENFKAIFGTVNFQLQQLSFEDITGKIKAEFEFEEMKFTVELKETAEAVTCEDGEMETEIINKEIEIEADYDAEDGVIDFEGSHLVVNEDGNIENELDFLVEASYTVNDDESLDLSFFSIVDEENFAEGEELFREENGFTFNFRKD